MTVLNGLRTVCNFSFRCWHNCVESWFPRSVKFLCGKSSQTYYVRCQTVIFFSYFTAALSLHFRLVRLKKRHFTLKMHQMFSVHPTPEKFENRSPAILNLCSRQYIEGKSNDYRKFIHRFRNTQFSKCFSSTQDCLGIMTKMFVLAEIWQCQCTVLCYDCNLNTQFSVMALSN